MARTKTQKHTHEGWQGFVVYEWSGADWYQTEAQHSQERDALESLALYQQRFPHDRFMVASACQTGGKGDTYAYRCEIFPDDHIARKLNRKYA